MLLHKTALARSALQTGTRAGLGLPERRILILCDGQRSTEDLTALLGADIGPTVERLLHDGYIQAIPKPASAVPAATGLAGALGGLLRASGEVMQTRTATRRNETAPAPATPSATPPPASRGGQRRSLAAAKMYLLDMLALLRHPDAEACRAQIQHCGGAEDALRDALLAGLKTLLRLTTDSYGQRVLARLGEALPEPMLPQLEAVRMQHAVAVQQASATG